MRITIAIAATLLLVPPLASAESPAPSQDPAPATSVAVIGKDASVSYGDLLQAAHGPIVEQDYDFQTRRHQLEVEYARAHHDLLEKQLGKLVDHRVLDLEAKARKKTAKELLGEIHAAPVTDADVRAFYDSRRGQISDSFEKISGQIRDYLAKQNTSQAEERFYSTLRAKYAVELTLEPLRAEVAAEGPSRGGSSEAPVTIVEFADFQCPYCRSLEPTLAELLKQYSGSVRLVFRHLPLQDIHPEAMHAAQAAVCADEQGKFWELHDAVYSDTSPLNIPRLRELTENLGLDSDKFESCVKSMGVAGTVIERDLNAARILALNGTPAMFINGRFVQGNLPIDALKKVIDDELRRSGHAATAQLTTAR